MNNIKLTAIRLIANAYLYGKEKNKECHAYRFDSSFLTAREITTIEQLNQLQDELNKLGWCFNIITFNDYIIQEKTWIGEMLKLGFGRIQEIKDDEIMCEYIQSLNSQITNRIVDMIKRLFETKQVTESYKINITGELITGEYKTSTIKIDCIPKAETKYISVRTDSLCTKVYGDYLAENSVVFSGNISKRWLDVISTNILNKEICHEN